MLCYVTKRKENQRETKEPHPHPNPNVTILMISGFRVFCFPFSSLPPWSSSSSWEDFPLPNKSAGIFCRSGVFGFCGAVHRCVCGDARSIISSISISSISISISHDALVVWGWWAWFGWWFQCVSYGALACWFHVISCSARRSLWSRERSAGSQGGARPHALRAVRRAVRAAAESTQRCARDDAPENTRGAA